VTFLSHANIIAIIWTIGIGVGAIIAGYLLTNERTKEWSEKKITLVSVLLSFLLVALIISFLRRG